MAAVYYKKFLTMTLMSACCFLCYSFPIAQAKQNEALTKEKFIVGTWLHKTYENGTFTLVFNKDGTGYRFTDSNRTIYRFKYFISKDRFLNLRVGNYATEKYYIKELSEKKLIINEYPFKKYRETINLYAGMYEKR